VVTSVKFSSEPRILVITLRRLGDVLLTTPLVRALKRGISGARIDMLVFRGSEGILAGNPDVNRVIAIPERQGAAAAVKLAAGLWRRYDLAVSTQTGDRPTLLAAIAGRERLGLVPRSGGAWKRWLLHRGVATDPELHRVIDLNRLASALGIDEQAALVLPRHPSPQAPPRAPYAVLHANPLYRVRRWTEEGWRALAEALHERGLAVVVTGGGSDAEQSYLDQLWGPLRVAVERTDGRLDWAELARLLSGAAVYVGPDTSMTHLAAGAGCPTVAIYGPASPHGMGPWPVGGLQQPWARAGTIQHRGNVWLVQNPLPCMPCDRLGCDNHLNSRSQCLDELSVRQVLHAVDQALGRIPAAPASSPETPAEDSVDQPARISRIASSFSNR
jgi:lipopolysaccharide heptosyltransferase III